jgi:hypothetical protein
MTLQLYRPEFLESFPDELAEGVLYVSMPYGTAAHKCACGCGNVVFTPFSPTDWRVTYNGSNVTLWPSIGNWNFPCQSHYWIEGGRVRWAPKWSKQQIERGRHTDSVAKEDFYDEVSTKQKIKDRRAERSNVITRIWDWLNGR